MWYDEAVVYQIYPLGLCGAPLQNDGDQSQADNHRILRVLDWVEHIKRLGATCVLFNPLFESDAHGYDTRDYNKVDCRLGTNDDLKQVCAALHAAGIKILFDGVFNHVGRGFWAFRDVQEKRWDSPYKDWFHISFDGNTNYNDGFWYEAWEGCNELVKLNLQNPAVKNYLFDVVRGWVRDYDIDGLRLDVAYCLDLGFLAELRGLANDIKPEFALVGETLHGDYNRWMNDHACHSVTNYECYKGLYSSFNTGNMHEISYSLNRQFGAEQWCLYTGKHLLSFVDNHDVTRIATILTNKNCLKPIYGLLFGMPGVPSVYYGSEWGMEGDKRNGDPTLRPAVEKPTENDLTAWVAALAHARTGSKALCWGSYRNVLVQPKQLIFERYADGERVLVAINADGNPFDAHFDAGCGRAAVLVLGFGPVGRALAVRLAALGARVTVAARRPVQRAMAEELGLRAVPLTELAAAAAAFDTVVNTIPAPVLTAAVLAALPKGCLIVDLASKPGGTDFAAARRLGHTALHALSLPTVWAPETAGEALARTVQAILQEREGTI